MNLLSNHCSKEKIQIRIEEWGGEREKRRHWSPGVLQRQRPGRGIPATHPRINKTYMRGRNQNPGREGISGFCEEGQVILLPAQSQATVSSRPVCDWLTRLPSEYKNTRRSSSYRQLLFKSGVHRRKQVAFAASHKQHAEKRKQR